MIILKVDTNPQSFKCIARSETYDGLFLTDESTHVETQVTIDSQSNNDYYKTIHTTFHTTYPAFHLVDDRFYKILIKNGTDIVYYDIVFVTNQNVSTFSVNNNFYNSNSSTNEFIIYE